MNKRYVLTAAHCVNTNQNTVPPKDVRVFVGFNDHCKNQNTKWEKGLKVKRIISRPDFPGINYTNDIALLKLK